MAGRALAPRRFCMLPIRAQHLRMSPSSGARSPTSWLPAAPEQRGCTMPTLYHFFISYSRESREDSQFALRLAKDLRDDGVPVWIDQLDLQPGQTVEEILAASAGLFVILSPESANFGQVMRE